MLLAGQDRVMTTAEAIARSTIQGVSIDWRASSEGKNFEQYLLDRAADGRIGRLAGLPVWSSHFTSEELVAAIQMRLQHILDYRTRCFLRVTAGVRRFGPVRFTFWTVEDPGL